MLPFNAIDKPTERREKIEVFDEKELQQFLGFKEEYTINFAKYLPHTKNNQQEYNKRGNKKTPTHHGV